MYEIVSVFDGGREVSRVYIYINRLVVQVLVNYFVEECVGVIL